MTNKVTEGGVISTELNQDILENPTENADNDDDLEQIELKVASIVREREERIPTRVRSHRNKSVK